MKLFEPKTFNLKNKTLQRLILGVVLVFLIFIFFVKISNTSTAAESTMYYGNDDSSNSVQWDSDADPTKNTGAIPTTITTSNGYNDDWCINPLSVQCWILPLFKLVRILFEVSNTLFLWIIDTDNIKTVLSSPALYTIWAFVRDLLNMVFIMALLFSAFCT
ncbi:hypothetical protein KJ761_02165, partial [Patescibacteria group bacterium]|nr:hypothetical protein [Patescibacteria group bacterium]